MIERLLGRAVRSRPTQAAVLVVLYAHNWRGRYRGERRGAVTTRRTQVPHGMMGTHR